MKFVPFGTDLLKIDECLVKLNEQGVTAILMAIAKSPSNLMGSVQKYFGSFCEEARICRASSQKEREVFYSAPKTPEGLQ